MSNIIDYINWRGDLDIKIDGFNEIDNLILARLSYFPFDGLIEEKEEVTIEESYKRYKKIGTTGRILQEEKPSALHLYIHHSVSSRWWNQGYYIKSEG